MNSHLKIVLSVMLVFFTGSMMAQVGSTVDKRGKAFDQADSICVQALETISDCIVNLPGDQRWHETFQTQLRALRTLCISEMDPAKQFPRIHSLIGFCQRQDSIINKKNLLRSGNSTPNQEQFIRNAFMDLLRHVSTLQQEIRMSKPLPEFNFERMKRMIVDTMQQWMSEQKTRPPYTFDSVYAKLNRLLDRTAPDTARNAFYQLLEQYFIKQSGHTTYTSWAIDSSTRDLLVRVDKNLQILLGDRGMLPQGDTNSKKKPNTNIGHIGWYQHNSIGIAYARIVNPGGNIRITPGAEVIVPLDTRLQKNPGYFVLLGILQGKWLLQPGIGYMERGLDYNISWKLTGARFFNQWGIGLSYSPLVDAGVHVLFQF